MAHNLGIMSVINLRPRKLGSFVEYTLLLSRCLAQLGGESILVFRDYPPESLRRHYTDAGAVLEVKPIEPFEPESALALIRLVQKYKPDIIHLHFVNMLSLDVLASSAHRNVKTFFSEHSSDIPKHRTVLRNGLLQASKRIFTSHIDQLIAPSDYVRTRLVREGVSAKKVATIHNGINVDIFRNAPALEDIRLKYGIRPDSVIVASISQLIPEKGIDYLIDAATLVLKEGRNVSFIHVGDGSYADEYRKKAFQLGIDKRFIFAGLLNRLEIADILHQSDIFTLPCTWGEAFSLSVLEAMATGKPLVLTSVGGNLEAVEDGRNGIVVPPHDAHALAAAIISLHDDPQRRREMGNESSKLSDNFTMQRWVDKTIEIYRSSL